MILSRPFIPLLLGGLGWMAQTVPAAVRLMEHSTATEVSATSCTPPAKVRYLLRDDPVVYVWFRVLDVRKGDLPTVKWLRPNGTVLFEQRWEAADKDGNFCYNSGMFIADREPARLPGEWRVQANWNGEELFVERFTILDWTPSPAISPGGVVNGADLTATFAPGILFSVFGTDLAPAAVTASGAPLPTEIERVVVEVVEGTKLHEAPLFFVSRGQINGQLPYGLTLGPIQIRVKWASRTTASQTITVCGRNPRLLTVDMSGRGSPIAVHTDGRLVSAGNPATGGEALILFLTGLGEVSPPVIAGAAAGDGTLGKPLSRVSEEVTVSVNGTRAAVLFAGLAPGFAGLYQLNFVTPASLATGTYAIQVGCSGSTSQTQVTMAVRGAAAGGQTVTPAGGSVTAPGLRLTIPPGAFSAAATLTVAALSTPGSYRLTGLPAAWDQPLRIEMDEVAHEAGATEPLIWVEFRTTPPMRAPLAVLPAQRDGGKIVAELPAQPALAEAEPALAPTTAKGSGRRYVDDQTRFIEMIIKQGFTYPPFNAQGEQIYQCSGNKLFEFVLPEQGWQTRLWLVCDVEKSLESARKMLSQDLGLDMAKSGRTWPVKVYLGDLVSEGNEIDGRENKLWSRTDQTFTLSWPRLVNQETRAQVIAAAGHEFFHIIQNLYYPKHWVWMNWGRVGQWLWFWEAASMWLESALAPNPTTYNPTPMQSDSLDFMPKGLGHQAMSRGDEQDFGYGASLFLQFLSKQFDKKIVGDILKLSETYPEYPTQAIEQALASRGGSLRDSWLQFGKTFMDKTVFSSGWPDGEAVAKIAQREQYVWRLNELTFDKPEIENVKEWRQPGMSIRPYVAYLSEEWTPETTVSFNLRWPFDNVAFDIYRLNNKPDNWPVRIRRCEPRTECVVDRPAEIAKRGEILLLIVTSARGTGPEYLDELNPANLPFHLRAVIKGGVMQSEHIRESLSRLNGASTVTINLSGGYECRNKVTGASGLCSFPRIAVTGIKSSTDAMQFFGNYSSEVLSLTTSASGTFAIKPDANPSLTALVLEGLFSYTWEGDPGYTRFNFNVKDLPCVRGSATFEARGADVVKYISNPRFETSTGILSGVVGGTQVNNALLTVTFSK